jgi:hypothetical protein
VLHRETVTIGDAAEHRLQDRLVEIFDPLAAGADKVMVVLGIAGDVRRHVTPPLEPPCHPALDLRLESPIDGGERQAWVARAELLVQLLRRDRFPTSGQCLRDHEPLVGKPPSAGADALRQALVFRRHTDSVARTIVLSSMILDRVLTSILNNPGRSP